MTTYTIPEPTLLAHDHVGQLAVFDGTVFYLTACCGASAKGSGDGQTVCRKCYREIDPRLGNGWQVIDAAAWQRWSDAWVQASPATRQRAVRELATLARVKAESVLLAEWAAQG